MSTLTKVALGFVGRLKPDRVKSRAVAPGLSQQTLSNLLWAAFGINRPESGGRTAPSALDAQEIDLYAAVRGWFDHAALTQALRLGEHEHVVMTQTVGYPRGFV
jgi:hypothetical protein